MVATAGIWGCPECGAINSSLTPDFCPVCEYRLGGTFRTFPSSRGFPASRPSASSASHPPAAPPQASHSPPPPPPASHLPAQSSSAPHSPASRLSVANPSEPRSSTTQEFATETPRDGLGNNIPLSSAQEASFGESAEPSERRDLGQQQAITPWNESLFWEELVEATEYKTVARRLARELDGVEIKSINIIERKSRLDKIKEKVESYTNEIWDWWPLANCASGAVWIHWTCTCGDRRQLSIPQSLGKSIQEMLSLDQQRGIFTAFSQQTSGQGQSQVGSHPPIPLQTIMTGSEQHSSQQSSTSQTAPTPTSPGHGFQVTIGSPTTATPNTLPTTMKVMLLVRSHYDYYLAQLDVSGTNTVQFFAMLRKEYLRLRGFFARYFSVWRFSHCDFYRFEKFDENSFAPTKRDEYPDPTNPDYDYNPKPMENIPPITPHEFKKRFDSCITHKLHLLCHKSCHCTHLKRKAHNAEIMDLLPKKLSHLDSGSDQREVFWGLYARQMILFRRILLYNVLCISPFMWFLLMWTLKWEKGDFQNGSVLLMAMLSLLTLFWTTFIANLQLGRGAHTN